MLKSVALLVISVLPVVSAGICRILSLSGGGSHGAFEAGVLSNLISQSTWVPWDVHTGVSAGSLGILGLTKTNYEENLEKVRGIWEVTTTFDVIEPLASKNSLSGNSKVRRLISETINDLTGLPSPGRFVVGVTDLIVGDFVALPLNTRALEHNYVLASTSIPVVFPPEPLVYNGRDMLAADGGLQKNEFFQSALSYCDPTSTSYEMDLVLANYMTLEDSKGPWDLYHILTRSIGIIMNDFNNIYHKSVLECAQETPGGLHLTVRVHMPPSPINIGVLDFNQGAYMWELGRYNATTSVYHC
jgi:hypothetical protein